MRLIFTAAMLGAAPVAAVAQQVADDDYTFASGVMVTTGDILTCPYRAMQKVKASVTEDYGADSREKTFGKLRKEAQKLGADAVVKVVKGDSHMTLWAFNRREYEGLAVKFVDRGCAPSLAK